MFRGALDLARQLAEDVLAAFLPPACRACGRDIDTGSPPPRAARPHAAAFDGRLRRRLAGPFDMPLPILCPACAARLGRRPSTSGLPGRPGVACVTAFAPGPEVFALVHALKYAGLVEVVPWLGALLAAAARRALGPALVGAALVPVPLHARRYAERGFNQSALLAHAVAARLGVPVLASALVRCRDTRPQAELEHAARDANVAGAFAPCMPAPRSAAIVLVDDVVTSGATARAALGALAAPAAAVLALCRARDAERPTASGAFVIEGNLVAGARPATGPIARRVDGCATAPVS